MRRLLTTYVSIVLWWCSVAQVQVRFESAFSMSARVTPWSFRARLVPLFSTMAVSLWSSPGNTRTYAPPEPTDGAC